MVPQSRFEGLVGTGDTGQSTAEFLAGNGLISVRTTTKRSFSGTLRLGQDRISLKGSFAADGSAQLKDLKRKSGAPEIDLDLQLESGPKIDGAANIVGSGQVLPFVALVPTSYPATKYTAAVVSKADAAYAGHGYVILSTDSKGAARIAGKLADGSKITASSVISDGAGEGLAAEKLVPVFIPLGKAQGALSGEMQIDKEEPTQGSSIDDGGQAWGWVKPGSSAPAELSIKGRSFALTKGVSILTNTPNGGGFLVLGVQAGAPLAGMWTGSNKPLFDNANDKLAFSTANGSVKGTIKDPKTAFEGVMFAMPISLTGGAPAVHGAGFRLEGPAASRPTEIRAR